MTDTLPYRDYCLEKYHNRKAVDLINRKLLIHKQLEKPPRTYAVYSDLHGSYEKYLHWLKNGMGFYKIIVAQVLGESYASSITECYERLLFVINRRKFDTIERFIESDDDDLDLRSYFFEPVPKEFVVILSRLGELGLTHRRVLLDSIQLLRSITRGDERRIIKMVPQEYLENILKLFHQNDEESFEGLVEGIVSNDVIYHFMVSLLVRLVVNNVFDKHINLGDTFDRGDGADKLMKLYRICFGDLESESPLHYIWGNHDILWLGAAIGNPILCIEALRVSLRYNNLAFLSRYGFSLEKLRALADKTYQLAPSGSDIKSKDFPKEECDIAAKMAKTLLMIQMKMTLQLLREAVKVPGEIDYSIELKRHEELMAMLPVGMKESEESWQEKMSENPLFRDVYFPTLKEGDPAELTAEEQSLVDDFVSQFQTLPKLRKDMRWLFEKGETYRVVDNTLYFHAAIPATENFELSETKGRSGKSLLDFIQRDLKRISGKHNQGEDVTLREQMLLWYLWCGSDSPFFCKSKMATLERAVFHKEEAAKDPLTTHLEKANPFYKNIRDDQFLGKLLSEFHADKLCMGHTPIKTIRQAILSDSIRAFLVDGGASAAYGDRGVVLINTPDYSYLTFHPALDQLKKAEEENRLPEIQVKQLEEKGRLRLKHMDKGYFLERELEAIDEILSGKLSEFKEEYFL